MVITRSLSGRRERDETPPSSQQREPTVTATPPPPSSPSVQPPSRPPTATEGVMAPAATPPRGDTAAQQQPPTVTPPRGDTAAQQQPPTITPPRGNTAAQQHPPRGDTATQQQQSTGPHRHADRAATTTDPTTTSTGTTTAPTYTWDSGTTTSYETESRATLVNAETSGRTQSRKSSASKRSVKEQKLKKVEEKMLMLQLELEKIRKDAIEEEESDDDTVSQISRAQTDHRVRTWLNESATTFHQLPALREPSPVPVQPPPPPQPTQQALQPATQPASESAKVTVDLKELITSIAEATRTTAQPAYRRNVELPTYSGSHLEWLNFKAAFEETASYYSESENIARFRRCLKGPAKEAVDRLLYANASVQEVMKSLEHQFGHSDNIAHMEIERLVALPRLTDNPRDMLSFSNKVCNTVAVLKALKKEHFLHDSRALKATVEKFSPTIRHLWYAYAAGRAQEEPALLKLASFLQVQADICAPYAPPVTEKTEGNRQQRPTMKSHKTFVAVESESVNSNRDNNSVNRNSNSVNRNSNSVNRDSANSKQNKCVLCDGDHTIIKCSQFLNKDSDSRWDIAKAQQLCYRCLRFRGRKHHCNKVTCRVEGCDRTHHTLLHFNYSATANNKVDSVNAQCEIDTPQVENSVSRDTTVPAIVHKVNVVSKANALLKIIPVSIAGPAGVEHTHALLDDGSTITLLDAGLARRTGCAGPIKPLSIQGIQERDLENAQSQEVTIDIGGSGSEDTHQIKARTIENLRLHSQSIQHEDVSGYQHLEDIADQLIYERAYPRILIGQDNWHLLEAHEYRRGSFHQPIATRTTLGWVLHGSYPRISQHRVNYVNNTEEDEKMDEQLKQHFAIESLAITPKRPQNDPEEKAMKILTESTAQREDGHFETGLLWKREDATLPSNYDNAVKRLHSIEKKIDKDPELRASYNQQMTALVDKGYAEVAPADSNPKRTWYLPHFAVTNPMKPGKVRIVHDAAAKTRGVSLNDHLLTGPDLLQSLPGVLMRFRQHPIAVTADIAEMFMQVKIQKTDRDALRYLWRGDERGDTAPRQYRMTSLIFGATSSPATAIYVKNVNAEKYRQTEPAAYDAIVRNHYVDDYLQSFPTASEAIETAGRVRDIHREAKYELRQWASNSPEVLKAMDPTTEQQEVQLEDGAKLERLLGLVWRPATDELAFNLDMKRLAPEVLQKDTPTKREALKIVMSLFDPLGIAAPVTSKAKQLLQEIWRRGTGWDEPINTDLAEQWQEWKYQLETLKNVRIPRCYLHYTDAAEIELHTFVDASESAYAAALYWRTVSPDGQVSLSLVMGKSKVAPLKTTSIPRLELQGAVMGSRMAATVIEEHDRKPDRCYYWTDSKTVLTWLKTGSRSYKAYVAHRIAAIEEHTKVNEWRWVPTKLNVADDATRDVPQQFRTEHRWFQGPDFLREDPSSWPADQPVTEQATGEEKAYVITAKPKDSLTEALPAIEKFSKWEKYVRTTARVLQFIGLCRQKIEAVHYKRVKKNAEQDAAWRKNGQAKKKTATAPVKKMKTTKYLPIDVSLLDRAEELIIRSSQQETFGEEIKDMNSGRSLNTNSRLRTLAVEIVNGVIRLVTRIGGVAGVSERTKSPPVLDGNHRAARLYIESLHRRLHHSGVEAIVNECRQHFWVLRLRPTVKTVVSQCLACRIRRKQPATPPTGNHPEARLGHHQRPFTFVGVDYFGPLTVTVGRGTQKRYVALFTCLTTRAVHLEVAGTLSTDSAVMALRRMIARRGCPTEIWSDNGTNLVGANKELRQAAEEATQGEAERRKIRWRFIPPSAPFMGGAWERLVRSVKVALQATLNERSPSEEVLTTLLAEAEYTVNSRPLTHVSVDPDDPEAITPNHILLGGSALTPAPGTFDDRDLIGRTYWRASQRLADIFWARWVKEYLPQLQHRREPHGRGDRLQIGDVVLIADGNLPRNTWPRGVVTQIYPGTDNVVRAADVNTRGGVLRRPTKKLVVIASSSSTVT